MASEFDETDVDSPPFNIDPESDTPAEEADCSLSESKTEFVETETSFSTSPEPTEATTNSEIAADESSARTFVSIVEPPPEEKRRRSQMEVVDDVLRDPWSLNKDPGSRSVKLSFKQPTSPTLDRYPSFFNSRRSVNMSNCSSPNVFRTLQKSPSRKLINEDMYPAMDPQVVDAMKELDEYRKKFEKDGNYLEANAAAAKINKLKALEDEKRRTGMYDRHAREREMAKKAYTTELEERVRLWDDKLKVFHREVMEHAAQLKRQHTAAIQCFRGKMTSKTPSKPQWSRELLKLRKVQDYLGKQGKYMDAQEVKRQADQLEQDELQATLQAYHNEVTVKEQSIRSKQQVELEVLLQRAAQARDELRRNRSQDLERCHQRHKNVVRELKAVHAQESFRFDHFLGKRSESRKSVSASGYGRQGVGSYEEDVTSTIGTHS